MNEVEKRIQEAIWLLRNYRVVIYSIIKQSQK